MNKEIGTRVCYTEDSLGTREQVIGIITAYAAADRSWVFVQIEDSTVPSWIGHVWILRTRQVSVAHSWERAA